VAQRSNAVMRSSLLQVVALFLKLGFIGFGGPAAHVALMHDEVVRRRKWLDEQRFLDLLGATNLIPGPNSTEMAIHIGYLRAGWPGLILGGASFIIPAMAIVMALAWAYVRYGSAPQAGWVLGGIVPVIIAVIAQALWSLSRKAIRGWLTGFIGFGVFTLQLLGLDELLLLFAGGILAMFVINLPRMRAGAAPPPAGAFLALGLPLIAAVPFSLTTLFLTFLKIGSILYGGGYVLLAFLRADLVERLGWLTERQLLDAIAIGQVTPGPLFTTATFIGYVLGGVPGSILATLGMFLPAFVFVAISNPLIPRLRASPWAGAFLDGINAASLGLMAAVTVQIAGSALRSPIAIGLALVSALLLFRFKLNSMWLVALGAVAGLLAGLLGL
jgi:chromate transporter